MLIKKKYLTIDIKMLFVYFHLVSCNERYIYFLSIDIKKELVIKTIYISFSLVSKSWLASLRLVFNASFTLNWLFLIKKNLFSFNWYHDSLILTFFNWYHVGRICFIVYLDPFVDDWQKGGEVFSIWVYIHDFYMHDFYLFIYKKGEKYFVVLFYTSLIVFVLLMSRIFLLISRPLFKEHVLYISLFYACLCIVMFNIHCIYLLFIAMHELRGSFFEA